MIRCDWVPLNNPIYVDYHDNEWCIPKYDDKLLFELLILESAQAGLSWITILKKRANYQKAYDSFDPNIVAFYDENKINSLLSDKGIIRNKRKINSSINNAAKFLKIQNEYGSFSEYIWNFTNGKIIKNHLNNSKEMQTESPLSNKISKDLKRRGFTFVGPTIIYSYLQSIGIINDHTIDCFCNNIS